VQTSQRLIPLRLPVLGRHPLQRFDPCPEHRRRRRRLLIGDISALDHSEGRFGLTVGQPPRSGSRLYFHTCENVLCTLSEVACPSSDDDSCAGRSAIPQGNSPFRIFTITGCQRQLHLYGYIDVTPPTGPPRLGALRDALRRPRSRYHGVHGGLWRRAIAMDFQEAFALPPDEAK
jgi:hypothetical protein